MTLLALNWLTIGTKDEDDDEYIVLTSERVKNSELANPENGYYYKRMTGAEFKKAVDDEKSMARTLFFTQKSLPLISEKVLTQSSRRV